ncbi:hypothetical protein JG687_00002852 [Phytophthora cactorum]|uniref:Uncharacterized protein n=1 Tax=Phytophthora cactorum TaxID=29920 RepID=A0A8T1UTX5_9STRA|nr:hypothetical protein JG687_00002852 [Phytophthora cactorum]
MNVFSFEYRYLFSTSKLRKLTRGKRLSDDDRTIIESAYKFFLEGRTRELVQQCLVAPTRTVALIWRAYKTKEGSDTFEEVAICSYLSSIIFVSMAGTGGRGTTSMVKMITFKILYRKFNWDL